MKKHIKTEEKGNKTSNKADVTFNKQLEATKLEWDKWFHDSLIWVEFIYETSSAATAEWELNEVPEVCQLIFVNAWFNS